MVGKVLNKMQIFFHNRFQSKAIITTLFLISYVLFLNLYFHFFLKEPTFYDMLQLKPTSTLQEIKKSYRNYSLKHHPDKNQQTNHESYVTHQDMYDILQNPDTRWLYD